MSAWRKDSVMATAHLTHGFAGAGKTTFARRLECEIDAVRFTHDEWMHRLYGHTPPQADFFKLYDQVNALIWDCALRLLELGVDVILDQGFWSRKARDEARQRLDKADAEHVLYYIRTPEEVMRKRVASRSHDTPLDSLWINEPAFQDFKNRFEPLGPDEEHVIIDGRDIEQARL